MICRLLHHKLGLEIGTFSNIYFNQIRFRWGICWKLNFELFVNYLETGAAVVTIKKIVWFEYVCHLFSWAQRRYSDRQYDTNLNLIHDFFITNRCWVGYHEAPTILTKEASQTPRSTIFHLYMLKKSAFVYLFAPHTYQIHCAHWW